MVEALYEDNYPHDTSAWRFRFDTPYKNDLQFINHPFQQFDFSKRLSPFIKHPFNPECYELAEVADAFTSGTLSFDDFIWKHKWGAAGHKLILKPTAAILSELKPHLADYIAQRKVNFKLFRTDDGKEKIVELRFMTANHNGKIITVPMARIGHVSKNSDGTLSYKIHFGDNNQPGYGFSPVLIDETC